MKIVYAKRKRKKKKDKKNYIFAKEVNEIKMKKVIKEKFLLLKEKIKMEFNYFPKQILNWLPIKFILNVIRFRKELAEHSSWDYHFTLMMMKKSLIILKDGLINGNEVYEHRRLKIEKINRVIQIIENTEMSNHILMAESELGELKYANGIFNETPIERHHNRNVFKRSSEIEKEEWNELWEILKGKDNSPFISGKITYEDWFDGSDMRTWWN